MRNLNQNQKYFNPLSVAQARSNDQKMGVENLVGLSLYWDSPTRSRTDNHKNNLLENFKWYWLQMALFNTHCM